MASLNDKINEAFTTAAGGATPHDQIIVFLNTVINSWEDRKETPLIPGYFLLCMEGTTGDEDCKKHLFLVKFDYGNKVVAKFRRCNGGIQVKEAEGDSVWRLFEENMMDMNGGRRRKSRRRKSKRSSTKSKKNVRRRTTRH